MPRCPMCGGPGMPLGVLGFLKWFACRHCGWEFSRKITGRKKRDRKEK